MKALLALAFALFVPLTAVAEDAAKPIKALYVTGGGYHDYKKLAVLLPEGIARQANVEFTIAWGLDPMKDPKLGEGYDVIVYNNCFAGDDNKELIANAVRVTKEGKPTVMLHCAMHTFMKSDEWTACCGLRTRSHDKYRELTTKRADPKHPVTLAWPDDWSTKGDELYRNIDFPKTSTPLLTAYSTESKKDHVVAWLHTYGKGPVFATTLGHDMNTATQDHYHKLIANGILHVTGKLGEDGKPKKGYEGKGETKKAEPASDEKK